MNAVFAKLWLWVWHLLPANPILIRVVTGASRRSRHLWLRAGYLSALLLVVLFLLITAMTGESGSLTDLAKGASQTFMWASVAQLAMMCFLAPVFTAAAITQERDAQTFNILLSTPLSNGQIVFGSLMSRLYFVVLLLLAGLPIFLVTTAYGGVGTAQIFESFALSGATAVLTGSLAIFVAMVRVGTRGTIFSFYLLIGLYLLCLYLLGLWDQTWLDTSPANLAGRRMSWLTPFHPFLALEVALNQVYAPSRAHLGDCSALTRFAWASPASFYVVWTLTLALVLTTVSVIFVRRGAKVGEPTVLNVIAGWFKRAPRGERMRKPRNVWANPVAWREARTRVASGAWLRWALIIGGLAGAVTLFIAHAGGGLSAGEVRRWLAALIVIQFAIAIIIATNTAATSMTKEKESKTMDLMLTTPLTSKYILWGKLRGLVSFAAPLLAGPVLMLVAFGLLGLGSTGAPPAIWIETGAELALLMVVYTAFACVISLRVSLVTKKNVTAVMYSVGLMILLYGAATLLGMAVVSGSGNEIGGFMAPFTPFTSIWYLVDSEQLFESTAAFTRGQIALRTAAAFGTAIAAVLYTFIIWSVYTGLVRNFDMIVRKQSGT